MKIDNRTGYMMNEPTTPPGRDDEDAARRSILVMIGVGIVVVVLGGWLVFALHNYLAHERCLSEGHRYCDGPPVEVPRQ